MPRMMTWFRPNYYNCSKIALGRRREKRQCIFFFAISGLGAVDFFQACAPRDLLRLKFSFLQNENSKYSDFADYLK
jgi:hypothetical protein